MLKDLVKIIKKTGYWKVLVQPSIFEKERISSLVEGKDLIRNCSVTIRGRDFPHIKGDEPDNGIDWIESGTDFIHIKEYWRFYQSAQFVYYSAIRDDYRKEKIMRKLPSPIYVYAPSYEDVPSRFMSYTNIVYRITEIYEFASRLAEKDVFGNSFNLSIAFKGMEDRLLITWTGDFSQPFICKLNEFEYQPSGEYKTNDFIANKHKYSEDCIVWIFQRFNWDSPPRALIREEQRKLLDMRW